MLKSLRNYLAAFVVTIGGFGTFLQYLGRNVEKSRIRAQEEEDQQKIVEEQEKETRENNPLYNVDWRKLIEAKRASGQQEEQSRS